LYQFDNVKSRDFKVSKTLTKTVTDDGEVKEYVTSKHLDKKYYEVKKGDTLYSIARKFKTSVDVIKEINGLKDNTISIGQKLLIR
jgi:LysM repeat protein